MPAWSGWVVGLATPLAVDGGEAGGGVLPRGECVAGRSERWKGEPLRRGQLVGEPGVADAADDRLERFADPAELAAVARNLGHDAGFELRVARVGLVDVDEA